MTSARIMWTFLSCVDLISPATIPALSALIGVGKSKQRELRRFNEEKITIDPRFGVGTHEGVRRVRGKEAGVEDGGGYPRSTRTVQITSSVSNPRKTAKSAAKGFFL